MQKKWSSFKAYILLKYVPPFVNCWINLSTLTARHNLVNERCNAILIDNTVIGHGITHESGWVSTGFKLWGDSQIETGYEARVPIHPFNEDSEQYRCICYLPGIAHLARQKLISIQTSAELLSERYRQPIGRFSGYQYFSYDVFNGVPFRSVDGITQDEFFSFEFMRTNSAKLQRQRINLSQDPLYIFLKQILGEKNSQDIWHICTAEKNGLYCFLTMDFKLLRTIHNYRNHDLIRKIKTKIWSPEQFGMHFGLHPIHPHLLSYHDASFPVRSDLNSAGVRRSKKNK